MENDIFDGSIPMTDQSPMDINATSIHIFPSLLAHPDEVDLNSRRQIMAGYPLISTLQAEAVDRHGGLGSTETPVSRSMPLNRELQEHFMEASLPTLLAARTGSHDNIISFPISAKPALPFEDLRACISSGACDSSNSSLSASMNSGYGDGALNDIEFVAPKKDAGADGLLNCKWNYGEILDGQVFNRRTATSTVCPLDHVVGISQLGWIPNKSSTIMNHPYSYCLSSKELSLSLATCPSSSIGVPNVLDQYSEISYSDVTQVELKENGCLEASFQNVMLGMGLGSEQTSTNTREISPGYGSCSPIQFSNVLLGSKYLRVAQQTLAEAAGHALENLAKMSGLVHGIESQETMSFRSSGKGISMMGSVEFPFSAEGIRSPGHLKLGPQRQELGTKKAELLAMLQVIDRRYNQCINQIQTISSFHAATKLHPQIHARFTLQTISILYKNLRERITNQILTTGECLSSDCTREKEKPFDYSFVENKWALQHPKRNDLQVWRLQRGLPEKSVSVLRAWLFQNFLHP
ncbi:uncharacterized protein LOC131217124 isoform X2 [Magnolia sinica]|nr:uncharacterized protein LOC131217124 isoform X2 [Magnolia sinica]